MLDQAPNTFRPDLAGDGLEKLEEVIQVRVVQYWWLSCFLWQFTEQTIIFYLFFSILHSFSLLYNLVLSFAIYFLYLHFFCILLSFSVFCYLFLYFAIFFCILQPFFLYFTIFLYLKILLFILQYFSVLLYSFFCFLIHLSVSL